MTEWLRPADAKCPKCGRVPALRFAQDTLHIYQGLSAWRGVQSYQCQGHGCGHVYVIRAEHIVHAKPDQIRKAA